MKIMAYLSVLMVLTPVSTLCVISFAMWRNAFRYVGYTYVFRTSFVLLIMLWAGYAAAWAFVRWVL